ALLRRNRSDLTTRGPQQRCTATVLGPAKLRLSLGLGRVIETKGPFHTLESKRRLIPMNATATPKAASAPNGRRPTLSDSIARFNQILDGLSEAIPQTIRDTLRESVAVAVAEGVRAALVEVFNGEAVQSLLGSALPAASAPSAAPPPSLGQRLL